jgi:DNA replication protein DnaC
VNSAGLVKNAVKAAKGIVANLDRWLMLSGTAGTGKSHILHAIATELHPMAMYIVSSDFELKLRTFLSGNDEEKAKINTFMNALITHPILIFDDIGLEYMSPWIHAKFDALIDDRARDRYWFDRLTIGATNIALKDFDAVLERNGASRSASRLKQLSRVDWLVMDGIDYREKRP